METYEFITIDAFTHEPEILRTSNSCGLDVCEAVAGEMFEKEHPGAEIHMLNLLVQRDLRLQSPAGIDAGALGSAFVLINMTLPVAGSIGHLHKALGLPLSHPIKSAMYSIAWRLKNEAR